MYLPHLYVTNPGPFACRHTEAHSALLCATHPSSSSSSSSSSVVVSVECRRQCRFCAPKRRLARASSSRSLALLSSSSSSWSTCVQCGAGWCLSAHLRIDMASAQPGSATGAATPFATVNVSPFLWYVRPPFACFFASYAPIFVKSSSSS
jgi:hypothetical protein